MSIFDEQIARKDVAIRKGNFLKKARKKHGNRYDYSYIVYKNNTTKVKIICEKHGEFWQQPNHHASGIGCMRCGRDVCAEKFKKELNDDQLKYVKDNIDKFPMIHFQKKFGLCDQTIRKSMKLNGIKWKSCDYNKPIYKDIGKHIWWSLLNGAKTRNLCVSITPKDVWDVYIKQNKKCALSGVPIFFGKTKKSETTASVDRINSELGYTIDNIQIIHKKINVMKMDLRQEDFINICIQIADNYNNGNNQ